MRITAWLFGVLLSILGSVAGAETLSYTTYYHNDHLGSPVAATNEQGALLWRAHFRPYGERQEDPKEISFGSVGYTGHIQDADSGMVYAGARYYDPLIGRFMAIDPVGAVASMPGSFNRYAYVNNNPYSYVDPDGRWAMAALALTGAGLTTYNTYNTYQSEGAAAAAEGLVVDTALSAVGVGFIKHGTSLLKIFKGSGKLESAGSSAESVADAALSAGQKSGAAAELRVGDKVFTGVSGEVTPHSSSVTGALMGTPASARKPWHGGCAEIVCLDKALNAGVDPKGGTMRAVNIGISGNGHNTAKGICTSCKSVMDHMGVNGK